MEMSDFFGMVAKSYCGCLDFNLVMEVRALNFFSAYSDYCR